MTPKEQIAVLRKLSTEGAKMLADTGMALLTTQDIDDILDIVDTRACVKEDLELVAQAIYFLENNM